MTTVNNKKRALPREEEEWNGYESLMNVNPKERYDIKASIFDLNTIRDSTLFEKERFSFCLSPPKENPNTFNFLKNTSSPKNKTNKSPKGVNNVNGNTAKQQTPIPQQVHKFQPLPGRVKKESLPPSVQYQQNHQYNTRKVPSSMPQQQILFNNHGRQPSTTLSNIPSSPIKSLSQLPQSPIKKRFSSSSSSNLLQQYQTPPPQQPSTKKIATLTNNIITNNNNNMIPLQIKPSTPTRPSNGTLTKQNTPNKYQSPITTNDLTTITTTTNNKTNNNKSSSSLTKSINASTAANNAIISESKDNDNFLEAKFESRIKCLEIENKLLKSKDNEKDKIIDSLNSRVSELEYQLANFIVEVKDILATNNFKQ